MRFVSLLMLLCVVSIGCEHSSSSPFSRTDNGLPSPIVTAVPVPGPDPNPVTPSISFDSPNPLALTASDPLITITATGSPAGGTMSFSTSSGIPSGTLVSTGGVTSGTMAFTPHPIAGETVVIGCTYTLSGVPVSVDYTILVTALTPSISFDMPNPLALTAGDPLASVITATGSPAGGTMSFSTSSGIPNGTLVSTGGVTSGTITFTPHPVAGETVVIACTYTFSGVPVSVDYTILVTGATFIHPFELSSLSGSNGSILNGIDPSDLSGNAVSAGDINGDGFDDILIGAYYADPGGRSNAGETYVVFGSATGFSASLELSALDGTNGFVLNGIDPGDLSGWSVSAGDINGDGVDDVLIGARDADPSGRSLAGETYVVFGSTTSFSASLELSALDGTNGFVLNGIDSLDTSGYSVCAGDINGDGVDDVLIGTLYADPAGRSNAGETYVVFGSTTGFGASLELSALDGTNGFVLNGIAPDDNSGTAVSAGDINGDGVDDVLISATDADPGGRIRAGETYVVFGSATGFSASLELSTLNGTNGFVLNGIDPFDELGNSVSAGDINGDGVDDVLIGTFGADPGGRSRAGETYVVFGSATGFSASLELSALDGTNGFVLNGIDPGDELGYSVSAGDINGDGVDDLLIGAPSGDPGGRSDAGETYVVFGSVTGFSASLELSTLDGTNGFVLNGIDPGDYLGWSVSAGDINGDGVDDLLISTPSGDPGGRSGAGETYVVLNATF